MLTEVGDGVWVRQSAWVWTNAIVVRGEVGLVLVDPGINGAELDQLADDLDRLGIPVVAGFCTHPHWDHLLWHRRRARSSSIGAHAVGHAAVLLADRGVLLAGDMLSDVLIPLLDAGQPDQVGAYELALDRLGEAAMQADVVVPGHGAVAEGPEVAARLTADRAYVNALRRGEKPVDAHLADAEWLVRPHLSNVDQARRR